MTTETPAAAQSDSSNRWSMDDLRRLHAPVVGDVLDRLGRHHQFLPPEIRPVTPDMVVIGRAMPVLIADVFGPQRNPFGRLTEAVDDLRAGEVYLAYNGAGLSAAWGEILTVAATGRRAAGAVIDGFHRDTTGVLDHGFPVFSRGGYAQDAGARKSVLDFRVPVEVGGVLVTPGDLLLGDRDGVVVVPQDIEDEVVPCALDKVATENRVLAAVRDGMTTTEAFATFGVL